MTFLNIPFIRKSILFLAAAMLSVSAMAADFAKTKALAERGDADAQFMTGAMYHEGVGVRQDYAKAAKWVEKSAKQGDARAQFNLGMMYKEGKGVRQD